jgi:multisubunit Na+/H+ antiporter MnhG subunit
MSDLFLDSLITMLLAISVGFGGIGVIGLLLFPDIRSRMFTATRATIISFCTITLAVVLYALYTFQSNGGDQYITLVFHSVILLCIIIAANIVQYKTILNRTKTMTSCQKLSDQDTIEK